MQCCIHKLAMQFLFLLILHFTHTSSDLNSDRAALLSLRSAINGRALLWKTSNPTPCNWAGVQCENNRVMALRLPASSLTGQIPPNTLSNLTFLRTLSLRLNHLSGSFPSDLSQCTQLRNLYLQGNNFSGSLPSSLFSLHSLVRLNLAGNRFSGEISPGFSRLARLKTLHLENNQFSGSIPELKLPNMEQFNVSFNSLNGSVPKSLESISSSAFSGNNLCGKPLDSCPKNATSASPAFAVDGIFVSPSKKHHKLSGGAIAGIVIGSVVGFLTLLFIVFVLCRKRSGKKARSVALATIKRPEPEVYAGKAIVEGENEGSYNTSYSVATTGKGESGGGGGNVVANNKLVFLGNYDESVFDLEDLLKASAEVLGKGTFGTSYKAVLEFGNVVAIKRLRDVIISEKEFKERSEAIGALDQENLVRLRAYYYSREEKLLVYDYMPTGSLSAALHGNKGKGGGGGAGKTPLNWEVRSNIALGASRGIEFLHSQGPDASHGNIKSSNILLTESYKARLSDFGLAQVVGPSSSPTRVAGGYHAPEVTDDPHKSSQKADVYSFGVLLLELLTGKAPTHALMNEEGGVDLPRWVQSIVKEEWGSEVFDIELLRYQSVEDEMVQMLQLAVDCAAQYPDNRPSMSHVSRRIEDLCESSLQNHKPKSDQIFVL